MVTPHPTQTGSGGRLACTCMVVNPHPTTLIKLNPKEFNESKDKEVIKTSQEVSNPPMWDNE